jgi:D-cysteine desulfhydrase
VVGPLSPSDLDAIPRLDWVRAPTPVTALPGVAASLGLAYLGVKRDDLCEPFHGGNKPRKLEYVLAAAPYADAPVWAAAGGIGSGAVVALTGAARALGRRVEAHLFWTPLSDGVVENLAFTASGPTRIHYYGSRVAMGLRRPSVLIGARTRGVPVILPGATSPRGMIGCVRAGLELAAQVRAGELPEPQRVYVALGSGGTAVGIAMGLVLGGLRTTVAAVAVVERLFATRGRLRALERALRAELSLAGIEAPPGPLPIVLDHDHLGLGYAHPSAESLAACDALATEGIGLEPVYTGKAMSALFADARRLGLREVVFWNTVRRSPIPHDPDWRDRLPAALRRRLEAPAAGLFTRRRVLVTLGGAAAVALAVRITGYPPLPGWSGAVLAPWEAHVLHAAAEALVGDAATAAELAAIPERVDRYLTGMPPSVKREAHAMFAFVEHATTPLGRRLSRLTLLAAPDREAFLAGLEARGGVASQAYRAIRDLCVLGLYQQPSTWPALGYEGPRQPLGYDPRGPERWSWPAYDAMVAPAGAQPR